jgi:ATP-dependent DNA ligase
MQLPLFERRRVLHDHLSEIPHVSLCDGVVGEGKASFRAALAAGHEGVVAKRLTSLYVPGRRSAAWQKTKQRIDLPCVIIGYRTGPNGLRDLLMATLKDGKLAYVGGVELGIREAAALLAKLESMRKSSPVVPCAVAARWVRRSSRPGG